MPIRILFSHRKARICDEFGSATQYIILLIQVKLYKNSHATLNKHT